MKKYFELISIPVAFAVLCGWNLLARWLGLHQFTFDMFGKVFVAFLMFLVAIGFVRLVYIFMFPVLYKYFDSSFNFQKKGWRELTYKERLIYAVALYCSMLLLFGLIVNGL